MKFILDFFTGASGKLRTAVLAVVVSALALRFPALTTWLGEDIQRQIFSIADEIKSWGFAFILFFAKQFNVTGGSIDANVEIKRVLR